MRNVVKQVRPAAVIVGAVTLGMVGLSVAGGAPVGLAVVCAVLFWLV